MSPAANPWQALIEPRRPVPVEPRRTQDLSERCACAVKLLRLGPLCWFEFLCITGWPTAQAAAVLRDLRRAGVAYREAGEWRLSA